MTLRSIRPYAAHKNSELVQLIQIQGLKIWLRMTPVQDINCRKSGHFSGQDGDGLNLLRGSVLITSNLEITMRNKLYLIRDNLVYYFQRSLAKDTELGPSVSSHCVNF